MAISKLPTKYDPKATKELRERILSDQNLSQDLAQAIADVFAKHQITPQADQLVALEPVVTTKVPDTDFQARLAGGPLSHTQDLSVGVHLVETRAPIVNYAITASAWNG